MASSIESLESKIPETSSIDALRKDDENAIRSRIHEMQKVSKDKWFRDMRIEQLDINGLHDLERCLLEDDTAFSERILTRAKEDAQQFSTWKSSLGWHEGEKEEFLKENISRNPHGFYGISEESKEPIDQSVR